MADGFDLDLSDVLRLSANLGEVQVRAGHYIVPVMKKTALEVKKEARRTVAAGSKRWKALPRTIDFELTVFEGFGSGVINADIGYNRGQDAARLGNIREFGSVNVAPHNDLQNALDKESDAFEKGLSDALARAESVLTTDGSFSKSVAAVFRGSY